MNQTLSNQKSDRCLLFLANTYTYIESWPDVKSLPNELGQVDGIALNNANGELVVFHRGSRKWEAQ